MKRGNNYSGARWTFSHRRTAEERSASAKKAAATRKAREAAREANVGEKRTVVVGDFFYSSWGYDQTNVDYYQVTAVSKTGKTVELRKVGVSCVRGGDGGPADYIAPLADDFIGEPMRKTLRHYNYGNGPDVSVYIASYASAYLWDCTPRYQTGANWGH